MFCPKCGKDLPDNSKFCKYCGSQIKNKGTLSHVPASAGDDEKSKNIIIVGLVALIVVLIVVLQLSVLECSAILMRGCLQMLLHHHLL